jgi:hypothetical protein
MPGRFKKMRKWTLWRGRSSAKRNRRLCGVGARNLRALATRDSFALPKRGVVGMDDGENLDSLETYKGTSWNKLVLRREQW